MTGSPQAPEQQAGLRKQLGLTDLVLAQVLCVVGSSWVGIAAKLGRAHVAFWVGAIMLFYLPLAAVVIWLNRLMPLEGGLYQWAKLGFGEMAGFLTAWNLWVYAADRSGRDHLRGADGSGLHDRPFGGVAARQQAGHAAAYRHGDGGHRVGGRARTGRQQVAA